MLKSTLQSGKFSKNCKSILPPTGKKSFALQNIEKIISMGQERRLNDLEHCTCLLKLIFRSLMTNIVLSLGFVVSYICLAFLPDALNVFIISAFKGLTPVLTTIANFGKIQVVLLMYWGNVVSMILKLISQPRKFFHIKT